MKIKLKKNPTLTELSALPVSQRMRIVKTALSRCGYSMEGYTVAGTGKIILRMHALSSGGGGTSYRLPPSLLGGHQHE